jgi:hypothetical protein
MASRRSRWGYPGEWNDGHARQPKVGGLCSRCGQAVNVAERLSDGSEVCAWCASEDRASGRTG